MNKKTKIKLAVFFLLALVAAGIIFKNYSDNKRKNEMLQEQRDSEIKAKQEAIEAENKESQERDAYETPKCNEAESLLFSDDSDKYEKIIAITTDVIEKYPDSKRAYTLRGRAYGFSANAVPENKDKAMADLDKAIEFDESYGYGLFNKALVLELFGEYDESLEWYDKAIACEDDYPWSYYGKASIYGRRGDLQNTIDNLKKAIELKPSVKDTAKEEHDFDNVRQYKEFQDLINK